MSELILSEKEKALLEYLKEKKEVSFDQAKKDLGDNVVGTVGKLKGLGLADVKREYTGERRKLIILKEAEKIN